MTNLSSTYCKKCKYFSNIILLKQYILPTIFVLFIIGLVVFSNSNLIAAKTGLNLWFNNVVPSLFPFFIATHLLSNTDIVQFISNYCNCFMRPLFNVPRRICLCFCFRAY